MTKTAESFAQEYAERSGVTVEWLREQGREARPCSCDYEGCEGWQMVNVELWEEDQRMRGLL